MKEKLEALIASWPATNGDPPDGDFQRDYMAACEEHARELTALLAADAVLAAEVERLARHATHETLYAEEGTPHIYRDWAGRKVIVATVQVPEWHEDQLCGGREAFANAELWALLRNNLPAILAALRRPEPAADALTALRAVMGLNSVKTLFEAAEEYPHGEDDVAAELSALKLARAALRRSDMQKATDAATADNRPEPTADAVEAVARAIYLGLYEKDGGKWSAVETKDVWHDLARAALAALPRPEAVPLHALPDDEIDAVLAAVGDTTPTAELRATFATYRASREARPETDEGAARERALRIFVEGQRRKYEAGDGRMTIHECKANEVMKDVLAALAAAQEGGEMTETADITKATVFERWWEYRDLPNDVGVKQSAIKAGLVITSGGLLWLTENGKALRKTAEEARNLRVAIRAAERRLEELLTPTPSRAERGDG